MISSVFCCLVQVFFLIPFSCFRIVKFYRIFLIDYGVDKYNIGTGFGHFGIDVEDVSCYFLI